MKLHNYNDHMVAVKTSADTFHLPAGATSVVQGNPQGALPAGVQVVEEPATQVSAPARAADKTPSTKE